MALPCRKKKGLEHPVMSTSAPKHPHLLIQSVSDSALLNTVHPMTPGPEETRSKVPSCSDSDSGAEEQTGTSSSTSDNSSRSLFLGKGSRSISRRDLSAISPSPPVWTGAGPRTASLPTTDARPGPEDRGARSGNPGAGSCAAAPSSSVVLIQTSAAAASSSSVVLIERSAAEADAVSGADEGAGENVTDLSSETESSSSEGLAESGLGLELSVQQLTELADRMRRGIKIKDRYRLVSGLA